jgi:hypothetical protein
MKKVITYFMDNPCYLESKKLSNSHKVGKCVVDDIQYNGYVSNGYYYVVREDESKGFYGYRQKTDNYYPELDD